MPSVCVYCSWPTSLIMLCTGHARINVGPLALKARSQEDFEQWKERQGSLNSKCNSAARSRGRLIVKPFETCWFQHLTIIVSGCWGCRKGFDSLMMPGNISTIQLCSKHPVAAWQLIPWAGRNLFGVSVPLGKFITEWEAFWMLRWQCPSRA